MEIPMGLFFLSFLKTRNLNLLAASTEVKAPCKSCKRGEKPRFSAAGGELEKHPAKTLTHPLAPSLTREGESSVYGAGGELT